MNTAVAAALKPRYKIVGFERSSSPLPASKACYTIPIDPTKACNRGACLILRSRAGWFLVNPVRQQEGG